LSQESDITKGGSFSSDLDVSKKLELFSTMSPTSTAPQVSPNATIAEKSSAHVVAKWTCCKLTHNFGKHPTATAEWQCKQNK